MGFGRAVIAAFIGGVLAGVVLLAYRISRQTEKSLPEALADVPTEARKVYEDVRVKATDAVNKGMEKVQQKAGEAGEAFDEAV